LGIFDVRKTKSFLYLTERIISKASLNTNLKNQ